MLGSLWWQSVLTQPCTLAAARLQPRWTNHHEQRLSHNLSLHARKLPRTLDEHVAPPNKVVQRGPLSAENHVFSLAGTCTLDSVPHVFI